MNLLKYISIVLFFFTGSLLVFAQEQNSDNPITITGTVYDGETMQPLEIVAIDNGNYSSTFSELDGTYSITIKSNNDILTVKAFGYQTKTIPIGGKNKVDIYLYGIGYKSFSENANFGDIKKPLLFSAQAASVVNNGNRYLDIRTKGASSGDAVLKGNIAGLDVINRNGNHGAGADMFLRGYSSINATNQPLIVIDGMIFDNSDFGVPLINGNRANGFAGIDPNDIENITVIKDASSIYGAKGANGVIIIRTTHASEQVNHISFYMNGGVNYMNESLPMLGADDYKAYLNDFLLTAPGYSADSINKLPFNQNNADDYNYLKYHSNTDWQKELFEKSFSNNFGVQIKGGDDVALYALVVNYLKYNGALKNTDFSRFGMRFNSDINISSRFSLNSNISFSYNDANLLNGTDFTSSDNPLYSARIKAPFYSPYVIKGTAVTPVFSDYDEFEVSNPVAISDNMDQQNMSYRVFGSFNVNMKINTHLTASNLIGLSFNKNREKLFIPQSGIAPELLPNGIAYNKMMERVINHLAFNNDFRLKYINNFADKHNFTLLGGVRVNINDVEEDYAKEYNSANDQLRSIGNGVAALSTNGGMLGNWSNLSYYAVADYALFQKYFLTANITVDGSSKFGADADGLTLGDHVYGVFPAISAGWLISSEPFMSNINAVNVLKLRAGYGLTGNDDIGFYATEKYYTSQRLLAAKGLIRGNLMNSELKWETNTKMNFGLDAAFFNERLFLTADYFINKTDDMLYKNPVDYYTGFDYIWTNNGSFETRGFDIGANVNITKSDIRWNLGFNISKFETEVTSIYGDRDINEFYGANILTEVGKPVGVFYGYKTNGIYSTQLQAEYADMQALLTNTSLMDFRAGDVIFDDYNPDGIIDEQDMQVIGDPTPDFTGEINTRIQWKSITLDAALAFSYGNDVYNYIRYKLESMSASDNQTQAVLNRWIYDGQKNATLPRAEYGDPIGNSRFSDRWIEDGSYARLRNVTLTYEMPFKLRFFKSSQLYITGLNLVTFSNYKGLDPEFSISGSSLTRGIDLGMTPQSKAVFIGLRLQL